MLFAFNFCSTYMYIRNCVHIIFKIWYTNNYLVLFSTLCCTLDAGFDYEKMLQGNYNYSQDRSFLTGNEENPALLLSNVHNRTSARDGPMFGYKGPSMNTTSLILYNPPLSTTLLPRAPCSPPPPTKYTEADFLDVIGKKVLIVFLLAIH